jgi:hypothetical protein
MPLRENETSKVCRKDSAETRTREVNIKALLVSVSFDSQTDMQLVRCEEEKYKIACVLDDVECRDHLDSTTHAPSNSHTHGRDIRYCRRVRAHEDMKRLSVGMQSKCICMSTPLSNYNNNQS